MTWVSNHSASILWGYRAYLNGATDGELTTKGLSSSDVIFIKKFHECADAGANLASFCMWYPKKPAQVLKEMFKVFLTWKRSGGRLSQKYESYPHLMAALSARLDGVSENEMRMQGYTELEVLVVNKFLKTADKKIPIFRRCRQLGIEWVGVTKMIQIYQEKRGRRYHENSVTQVIPAPSMWLD